MASRRTSGGGRGRGRGRGHTTHKGGDRPFSVADLKRHLGSLRPASERSGSTVPKWRQGDGHQPPEPVHLSNWRKPGSVEDDRMIDMTPTKRRSRLGKVYDSLKKRYAKLTRSLRKYRSKKKYALPKYFMSKERSREHEYGAQDAEETRLLGRLLDPNITKGERAEIKFKIQKLGRIEPHQIREARLLRKAEMEQAMLQAQRHAERQAERSPEFVGV